MRLRATTHFHIGLLLTLVVLYGCGGGGGTEPGTQVAGVVTDVDGKPVAGATVSCSGQQTTSLSNGAFLISGVKRGFQVVTATITINGRRWSGETRVDIVPAEPNRSVNVMVSDERFQARLSGYVIDAAGYALPGAKIFVGGPWGSTMAISDSTGAYEVRRLTPGVKYTVTCSLAGYVNETKEISLRDREQANLSFALALGSYQGTIPAPENVSAQAWTIADRVTRSGARPSYVQWLQEFYRRKKGLPSRPRTTIPEGQQSSRSSVPGSLIEIDIFWDYKYWEDLFGYAIKRGTSSPPTVVTAVLRDPLSEAFLDLDSRLVPDTIYYYTVHCLDTVGFPANGRIGPASQVVQAYPLQPVVATGPGLGDIISGDPVFRWTSVNGAASYQVIVWDRFPDLQNANDPNGAVPLWPVDLNNPGSSKVSAPATSLRYNGPYLQSGRTYYWLVLAADEYEDALSVSRIMKFTAR